MEQNTLSDYQNQIVEEVQSKTNIDKDVITSFFDKTRSEEEIFEAIGIQKVYLRGMNAMQGVLEFTKQLHSYIKESEDAKQRGDMLLSSIKMAEMYKEFMRLIPVITFVDKNNNIVDAKVVEEKLQGNDLSIQEIEIFLISVAKLLNQTRSN